MRANAERNSRASQNLLSSEIDHIFSAPGPAWDTKSLSEIGLTQTGSTPKTNERDLYGTDMPFVKPGDFHVDGTLDYENDGISLLGAKGARVIKENSALMVCIGATIGKCGFTERPIATNQQINSLTPHRGYNHKLLYYQMISNAFQRKVMEGAGQATLPIINKSKWFALSLTFPRELTEQARLVQRLDFIADETRNLMATYRDKITLIDELKKSLLHQAFSGNL